LSGASLIQVERVTKRHGSVLALDGLSLEIAQGEFFALLGPSGCGKTSLLRLIAGFETPDQGRILIDGHDMTGVPPHRRPVNMMFQSYALFPHMDVAHNIAFGLKQEGVTKREIADRVAAILHLVQLEGLQKRRPDQLSGGQKSRVALARALVKRPKLLLLDEPLAALDRRLRETTQFEITRLQKSLGTSFLIVTHDQREAMVMTQRIAVMRAGRIEQIGAPAEIYEQPASRYVAEFIGDINLLPGKVVAADANRYTIATCAGSIELVCAKQHAEGQAVSVAVRPERIRIERLSGQGVLKPSPNRLTGRIEERAYLGEATLYTIKLDGDFLLRAVRQNASTDEGPMEPGGKIIATFAPEAASLIAQ